MEDTDKTKDQLLSELKGLRQNLFEMQSAATDGKYARSVIKESEEKYRDLVERASDGICIIQNSSVVFCNQRLAFLWGGPAAEIIGMPFIEFVHSDSRNEVALRHKRRVAGEDVPRIYEATLQRKDGSRVFVEINVGTVQYEGKPADMIIIRDITERKHTEEKIEHINMILRAIRNVNQLISQEKDEDRLLEGICRCLVETQGYYRSWLFRTDNSGNILNHAQAGWGEYFTAFLEKWQAGNVPQCAQKALAVPDVVITGNIPLNCSDCPLASGNDSKSLTVRLEHAGNIHGVLCTSIPGAFVMDEEINLFAETAADCAFAISNIENEKARRQMESELRQSEAFNASLLNNSPNPIVVMNPDSSIRYVSPSLERLTGYTAAELSGKKDPHPWWAEGTNQQTISSLQVKLAEGIPTEESLFRKKNGDLFWVNANGVMVEQDGKLLYIVVNWTDITERKQIEAELRQSEAFNASLLENAPNPVLVINSDRSVRYINPAFEKLTGFTVSECIGITEPHPWWIENETKALMDRIRTRQPKGGQPAEEVQLQKKNGERFWVNINTTRIGKDNELSYILINIVDITERKLSEEALQSSEVKLSEAMSIAKLGYWEFDTNENVFIFNDHFYSIFHTTAEKVGGYKLTPERYADLFVHPDDRYLVFDTMFMHSETPNSLVQHQLDHRIIYADGGIGYISVRSFVIKDEGGQIIRIYGANQDITDRKRAEEKYQTIVRTALDGFCLCDMKGKFLEVNESFCLMTGYTQDEFLKMSLEDVEATKNFEEIILHIGRIAGRGYDRFETRFKCKNDNFIDVEISARFYNDEGQIFVFIRDITERKQLEEEQQKATRLESIGTLAGGIAHDFNNILTGIMGNISLAMRDAEKGSHLADRLQEAEKASMRAKDLTHRLLTFARGGSPVKKTVSLADLVREATTFSLRGSNVSCEFMISDDLCLVDADEGQINQVFTNLILNACEAMPMGGILDVRARNVTSEEICSLPLTGDRYVEICITDYGTGISKNYLERIFEPYFTTKQRGSGLGLATAYSIIKSHDGHIRVESELGSGTSFHVYLPASENTEIEESKEKQDETIPGKGKILVMDDEQSIRLLLCKMLEWAGYEVELAEGGEEAIRIYTQARESAKPFSAVIMDLTIPGGMGGKEAIGKLREIDPDVKAIVSSGYSTDPIMADYKQYGFSGVVAKPYQAGEVEKTLRNVLLGSD